MTGPGPEPAQPVESGSPGSTGVSVDRITYVGPNGDLFTVNPDGSGQLKLTGGAQVEAGPVGAFMAQSLEVNDFYAWPTWSPDGSKVAASRVQVSGGQAEVSVEILDSATGRSVTAYQNDVPSLVADGAPHYLYWSPDSKWLAFLAATQSGLTLFVADIETMAEPVAVQSGAPLYFQWSGDSKSIMVHVGEELKRVGQPFGPTSETLVAATQGFRVPALSPDGKTLAYVGAGESGESLLLAQAQTPEQGRRAVDIGILSAFAWSPDGRQLAVADQEDARAPFFRRLRVFTAEGGSPKVVAEGQIMAFYWARSWMYSATGSGTKYRRDWPKADRLRISDPLMSIWGVETRVVLLVDREELADQAVQSKSSRPGRVTTTRWHNSRTRSGSFHRWNCSSTSSPTMKNKQAPPPSCRCSSSRVSTV